MTDTTPRLAEVMDVERTFAWLTRNRRLTVDYETNASSSEAFIQLAMIRLIVRRLVK